MKESFSFIFYLLISLNQLVHFGKAVDFGYNEIISEKKSKIELPSIQHSIWAWNENLPAQQNKRNTTQTSTTVPIAPTVLTSDTDVTQTNNSNWNENSDPNEIQSVSQKPFEDSNNLKAETNGDVGALPIDYLPNVAQSHPMIILKPETPDNSYSLAVDPGSARRSNPWAIYKGNVPVIYQKPGTNSWNIHPIYRSVPMNANPQIRPWNYQGYPPPMHHWPMYPWSYPEYGPSGGYPEYGPSGGYPGNGPPGGYPGNGPPGGYPDMPPWYPYPVNPSFPQPQPEGWYPSSEPSQTTTTTTTTTTSTTTPAPTTAPPTTAPPTTAPPATTPPATTPPATTPPATTPPATTPAATTPPATTPPATTAPPTTTTTTTTSTTPTYQPEPEPEWIFWPHWPPRPEGGYPAGGPRPPPPRPEGGKPMWPMPSYGPPN